MIKSASVLLLDNVFISDPTFINPEEEVKLQNNIFLFTYFNGGDLNASILSVTVSGGVAKLICVDPSITHEDWISV